MLNYKKTKNIKNMALISYGIELSNPDISLLNIGNYLTLLIGLKTLNALKLLTGIFGRLVSSVSPASTIAMSNQFQPSLK
jgi:hypothetical protein